MTTKILLVALASAITLGAASHSLAAGVLPSGYEERTMTLRVDDVNLESQAGAAKMLARIDFAADYVCGGAASRVDLGQRAQHRACVSATVDHTLTQLNSERVSDLHARPSQLTVAAYRGS
jgi:UrcA family protein